MKREQKMGFVGLFVVSLFLISPVFQNCSPVNFRSMDTNATQNSASTPTTTSVIKRKITIDPTYNQIKSDMKVLFIVDDSFTMSQSQQQLATAIDSLLNPLIGHQVEFKIVSTSGIPSNEVDFSISSKYFTDQNIEIPQDQLAGVTNYIIEKNVKVASANRHATLRLYRESTMSQFNTLKAKVKEAIQAVGINGSDTEEGLCATVRQIYDDSTSRFFKPGDKAAIVILTDENDTSVFNKCSSRYRQRVSSKPVVYYNYGQQRAKIALEYQQTRDGVTSWQPVVWGIGLSGARAVTVGDICTGNDQADAINKITAQGYIIRNVKSCFYEVVQASYYGADLGDAGTVSDKNLCTMTTVFNGKVYANFYAMITAIGLSAKPDSCGKQMIPGNTLSDAYEFDSVIKADPVAASSQDFKLSILNKSNELFGSTGYIFASLIRQEGESCALGSGQSYGVKYQELNVLLGPQKSVTQSLCNTDFSTTLSRVSQFIVSEVSNSYVVTLQSGESVLSVSVIRNSQTIKLTTSEYEAVGGTLTLRYTLVQGDTLEVELGPK